MDVQAVGQAPTQEEIYAEARRSKPWLYKPETDLDLSGRRAKLGSLQEAEDRLRVAHGLEPKYYEA